MIDDFSYDLFQKFKKAFPEDDIGLIFKKSGKAFVGINGHTTNIPWLQRRHLWNMGELERVMGNSQVYTGTQSTEGTREMQQWFEEYCAKQPRKLKATWTVDTSLDEQWFHPPSNAYEEMVKMFSKHIDEEIMNSMGLDATKTVLTQDGAVYNGIESKTVTF